MNVTLPITTRFLIWLSDFIRNYGLIVGASFLFVSVLAMILIKKSERIHYMVDRMLVTLPIVGGLVQSYNMANFTRTLGLLLKSGISILQAAKITSDTLTNRAYRKEALVVESIVLKGGKISKHLEKSPRLFPDVATQMIMIGETSGKLPETLIYLAEMYEREVDDLTKNLSSSIEPILMVVMGVIVGFVAISVITPIYEITQNISNSIH